MERLEINTQSGTQMVVSLSQTEMDSANVATAEEAAYHIANGYKQDRAGAYGSIQDQLDMIYWDQINGTTNWKDHVTAVKSAHPKPV